MDTTEIPADDPDFRREPSPPITEYHVIQALRNLNYNVSVVGAIDDTAELTGILNENKPNVVFNLTEQFSGDRRLDKNIVGLLEMLNIPYTGAEMMGLMLCRDKGLCKQLLSHHKIHIPGFVTLPPGRTVRIPKTLRYPLVVKPSFEDGSEGISNASLVSEQTTLMERASFVHQRWEQPAIAEEYIEGREFYVAVIGNKQLTVLPPRECFFKTDEDSGPLMLTYRAKWNEKYREKWNIRFGFAKLEDAVLKNIKNVCKKVYRILQLRDYGRIDLRLTSNNKIFILEANPNPDIGYGEEVAEAAAKAGISYENLIDRIVHMALRREH